MVLRHCDRNWKVPNSNGLRTQTSYKALAELGVKTWQSNDWQRLSETVHWQWLKSWARQKTDKKKISCPSSLTLKGGFLVPSEQLGVFSLSLSLGNNIFGEKIWHLRFWNLKYLCMHKLTIFIYYWQFTDEATLLIINPLHI